MRVQINQVLFNWISVFLPIPTICLRDIIVWSLLTVIVIKSTEQYGDIVSGLLNRA